MKATALLLNDGNVTLDVSFVGSGLTAERVTCYPKEALSRPGAPIEVSFDFLVPELIGPVIFNVDAKPSEKDAVRNKKTRLINSVGLNLLVLSI